MKIVFNERAWQEYIEWVSEDKKIVKKVNDLIKDIIRNPYDEIGKAKKLKYDKKDLYSRRINKEHRLAQFFCWHKEPKRLHFGFNFMNYLTFKIILV